MADLWQLTLLKRSVEEWNMWRKASPFVRVELSGADLREANLQGADLQGADLRDAFLLGADLQGAKLQGADLRNAFLWATHLMNSQLRGADLRDANLTDADLTDADLTDVDLRRAYLHNADFTRVDLTAANLYNVDFSETKGVILPPKNTSPEPGPNQSSSSTDWLSLVETVGGNLFVMAATLASIVQGADVIERRWREQKEKQQQQATHRAQPPSVSSTQPPSQKMPVSDTDIIEVLLVMDDGSQHGFKRWVSDPDALRTYIDAFSDPTSKVKPLRVVFMKRKGRALAVDVTEGGKDNRQLNAILDYLETDPQ